MAINMAITSVLYILNNKQRVTGIASNSNPEALPYFDDKLIESVETGEVTYEFSVPAKHPESEKLVANNHVVVRDLDGNFLLLTIKEIDESHEDGNLIKRVFCENTAVGELLGQIVEPQTLPSVNLSNAIKTLFKGVDEWSVLEIPYTQAQDITISEHTNLLEVLNDLAKRFEVEMYFTVELSGVHIKRKVIRFVQKRGQKTNMRFEYGLNLNDVRRREDSTGIITALYGLGKGDRDNAISLKNYPEYDDKKFYHNAMTEWIGSVDARQQYGRNGNHIFGIYKSDTADTSERLFKETLEELKRRSKPYLTYEASIVTLERVTGYEGQKVRIGDQVLVIDKTFKPAILLEARVVELQRSFTNPLDDAVKLGEYRPIKPSLSKLVGKLDSDMGNTIKYPDLPKIQQDFTDEVIKPIKNVVDEIEEEMENTVQAVVDIDAIMKEVQDKVKEVEKEVEDREVKIYRQPTPPTNVPVDTLWINTDKNIMYRWDGVTWIELAPDLEGVQEEINKAFDELDGKITAESEKVDAALKESEQKVADLQTDLADKVDAEWVNGQLVSKANKGDSYTKTESDNALNGKVSTTTYTTDKNGIITRLDGAETRVTQAEDKIKLSATKDELTQASDGLTSKINKVSSDLTVQAGLIEGKVSNSTYTTDKTANETRFKNAESRIAQTEKDITAKVNSTDVYKKTEIDPKLNAKVDTTVYNNKIASIEATSTSITQRVEEVNKTVTGLSVGGRNILLKTKGVKHSVVNGAEKPHTYFAFTSDVKQLIQGKELSIGFLFTGKVTAFGTTNKWIGIEVKVGYKDGTFGYYSSRVENRLTLNKDYYREFFGTTVKVLDKEITEVSAYSLARDFTGTATLENFKIELGNMPTDYTEAPEDINESIDSKVNTTDYNQKVTEIKATTDGITQSVSNVDKKVNDQGTRLTTAESKITQTEKDISLKVNASDVYKKAEVDGKVNSKVDATVYNNKIAEIKATTDSITQTVSSVSKTVGNTGNNILMNSGWYNDMKYWSLDAGVTRDDTLQFEGYPIVKIIQSGLTANSWRGTAHQFIPMTAGKTLTLSIWVWSPDPNSLDAGASCEVRSYDKSKNRIMAQTFAVDMKPTTANTWERKTRTFDLTDKAIQYIDFKPWVTKNGTIYIAKPQLEFGDVLTPWTPNTTDGLTMMYESKMASIDTTINGITQRVTNTENSTTSLGNRISTAEATIKTQAGQISSKVESTTYNTDMNGLKTRVSSAETFISQNKDNITLLAKADGVGSLLNQSPTGFKIAGRLLDIQGLVTFGTFDTATQNKINAIDTKAGDGVTKANAAQTTANTANGTANAVKSKTDNWTTNTTYIDGGKIYTNTITATQLNVNNIFANSAVISAISTYSINADRITGGKIKGITYESINASNPKIKVVIEGNTFKSYGASDGTKQNYSELKEGLIKVFEIAESGSPFGDKGTAIQPASVTVTHGGRNTKVFPTNLEFSVGSVKGTVDFEGVPNGGGVGFIFNVDSGIQVVTANADKPALQFSSNESVIYNGWGNIVGNPYSSANATWSIKDGNGNVRFITPVGKGGQQAIELKAPYGGINFYHENYQFIQFWGNSTNRIIRFGQDGGTFKWQNTSKSFEFRTSADNAWADATAGTFKNASSLVWKTDIKNFEESALDLIIATDVMTYRYKQDKPEVIQAMSDGVTIEDVEQPMHVGIISEYAPKIITGDDGKTVDLYAMISVAWKGIQELNLQINELKAENVLLKGRLDGLNN